MNDRNKTTFIAFSLISGEPLARGNTAAAALHEAITFHQLLDNDCLEVLDCGDQADGVWRLYAHPASLLPNVRRSSRVAFRGAFYDSEGWHGSRLPAVPLGQPDAETGPTSG